MGTAPQYLLVLLWVCFALAPTASSEEVGYSLDAAAGLFWHVEITADDGATSGGDAIDFFCCDDNDALVLGDRVGIVDPTFTPTTLRQLLAPAPALFLVGELPATLDLVLGSLTWSPPSGPTLMTGQSGAMETGPLTGARFTGVLTTPFGDSPFVRKLLHHLGGDTTLRRFSGPTDVGAPRLRMSTQQQVLDTLEIDEADLAGRVEMRSPFEVVLAVSPAVEAGSVSYPLGASAGLFWEITVTGDDGVLPPSSDTVFAFQGLDASVGGDTVGIVDPVFTPLSLEHSIVDPAIPLQVGAHGVTLDLDAALGWSPPSGPSLRSGEEAPLPTGDASAAAFSGTLTTPFGAVPFDLDLLDHTGSDMTLARIDGATELGPPRLQLGTTLEPLDTLEIDESDVSGRVDMRNPYEAELGAAGGVTWSISARVFFNDAFHVLLPSTPNGVARDVVWTLRSELLFNDVFHMNDPSVLPPTIPVPALALPSQILLGLLLVAGGLAGSRPRRSS